MTIKLNPGGRSCPRRQKSDEALPRNSMNKGREGRISTQGTGSYKQEMRLEEQTKATEDLRADIKEPGKDPVVIITIHLCCDLKSSLQIQRLHS